MKSVSCSSEEVWYRGSEVEREWYKRITSGCPLSFQKERGIDPEGELRVELVLMFVLWKRELVKRRRHTVLGKSAPK